MSTSTDKRTDKRQNLPHGAPPEHPILFFDGVCGLCSRAVDFVMARDREGVFRFAPLQGETARQMLTPADIASLETMALATSEGVFRRSAAAVRILWRLGPAWRVCGWLLWAIPRPLRDAGYNLVARTRYQLFGKHESCRLPTPEERERFLP
jgi:predicted DCC family thiol-disulfide oxidoreductase YuxK